MPTKTTETAIITYDGLASILDVKVRTVRAWNGRGLLPPPDLKAGQSPAWKQATLEPFILHYKTHGRPGFQPKK